MKEIWCCNPGAQCEFLASNDRELLYGGAAGGGKSEGIIVMPLRWITQTRFSAIILRRTRRELQELIDRSHILYKEICPKAEWNEARLRWSFPWGSFIHFGFADHEDEILNFKSEEFQLIVFDELTTFTEKMYLFMFTRNRTGDKSIPLYLRAATNPGDIGHEWVLQRFIKGRSPYESVDVPVMLPDGSEVITKRCFIPATAYDNPMINIKEYVAGMMHLPEDMRAALVYGRWDVFEGQFFRKMPEIVPPTLLDPHEYYIIRCGDYGWADATAIYWLAVYPRHQIIDIIGEIWATETTVPNICRLIQSRQQRLASEDLISTPPRISVLDPKCFIRDQTSQQSIAQMLSRHGQNFIKANNDRHAGWAMLRYVLEHGKLRVWRGRAPHFMRTLPTLVFHPVKKEDIKPGGNDHGADAMRYGVLAWYEQPAAKPPAPKADPLRQDVVFPKIVRDLERRQNRRLNAFPGL